MAGYEQARVTPEHGLEMLVRMPMGELMAMAHEVRMARFPAPRVTYVMDTNPNYTNICDTKCGFCAFHRNPGTGEEYTLTPEELADRVGASWEAGARTVLLQGGHNPDVRLKDWIAYIRAMRKRCPGIHIHPFSPSEYACMASLENMSVREVLMAVKEEGVATMPGGGAEILVDRVRGIVAPAKSDSAEWLGVMREAHELGFTTTATMMYGHVETDGEIIEHLVRLRELQDETGGFSSFIPWSFKPGDTPLSRQVRRKAHPARYVRIIATARLMLDNFDHVQSSWFSESVQAGQLGLLAGADDFGGVLIEENVLKTAGHERTSNEDTVRTIIRRAGFEPVRRDSFYRVERD